MSARFGRDKSKAALGIAATTKIVIEGEYEDDRIKFGNLSTALGVVYNGNVINNVQALDNINALDSAVSEILTVDLVSIIDRLNILENFMNNIYSIHSHDYQDSTINDTADGTGLESYTIKTTGEAK